MTQPMAWPPVSVSQRIMELKQLRDLVTILSGREEHATHLNRYLVVRSAGLVEAVRDDVADQYSRAVGSNRLHRRIVGGLRSGLGARPKQLVDFVKTFDPAWAEDLEKWLKEDDSLRSNALGALVQARTKIAHGDGASVGIGQVLNWSENALSIANWLITRFDPT